MEMCIRDRCCTGWGSGLGRLPGCSDSASRLPYARRAARLHSAVPAKRRVGWSFSVSSIGRLHIASPCFSPKASARWSPMRSGLRLVIRCAVHGAGTHPYPPDRKHPLSSYSCLLYTSQIHTDFILLIIRLINLCESV